MIRTTVLAIALLSIGVAIARAEDKQRVDLRKTELYLKTLTGQSTNLQPFAGAKLTLVNLWATWCGPCREEMPALDRLHKKYQAQGLTVVGVDVDEAGEVVKRFLGKMRVSYPMLLSTREKTAAVLGIEALPTTYLLDQGGDVLAVFVGGIDLAEVTHEIEAQLGGHPKPPAKSPAKSDTKR